LVQLSDSLARETLQEKMPLISNNEKKSTKHEKTGLKKYGEKLKQI
jgi:hypothetical protein